ncbi:MAG: hypothetical protein ACSLE9_14380 [Burkholderiaceae bacterium]
MHPQIAAERRGFGIVRQVLLRQPCDRFDPAKRLPRTIDRDQELQHARLPRHGRWIDPLLPMQARRLHAD